MKTNPKSLQASVSEASKHAIRYHSVSGAQIVVRREGRTGGLCAVFSDLSVVAATVPDAATALATLSHFGAVPQTVSDVLREYVVTAADGERRLIRADSLAEALVYAIEWGAPEFPSKSSAPIMAKDWVGASAEYAPRSAWHCVRTFLQDGIPPALS